MSVELSAIVSQNLFVLVFLGYRTSIARYVTKWGIALIKQGPQRGASHPYGGLLGWLGKYRAIGGIAAIASQYCKNQRKSAKNCEFGSVCPFWFVPSISPRTTIGTGTAGTVFRSRNQNVPLNCTRVNARKTSTRGTVRTENQTGLNGSMHEPHPNRHHP